MEETYARLAPSDAAGGIPGERTLNNIWPIWITPLDFDGNGTPDFSVEFNTGQGNGGLPLDLPIIWLSDGTGRYSTLKVGDFVADADRASRGMPMW